MQIGVGPAVDRLDGIGGQVVELPLVVQGTGAVNLAAETVRRQLPHTGLGPGGRVVEAADELPQMTGATGCLGLVYPHDQTLEVRRGMGWNPDTKGRRGIDGLLEHPAHPGGAAVTLEHVVPGHQIHRTVLLGRNAVDHRHEVAPWQWVHFGE